MVAPSARGSEKGIPSSTMSAPGVDKDGNKPHRALQVRIADGKEDHQPRSMIGAESPEPPGDTAHIHPPVTANITLTPLNMR